MSQWRWLGSLFVLVVAASASAQSRDITVESMRNEKRVALVIGNAAYVSSPLKNPVHDARAMAQTLKGLGFEVIARENIGEKDMRRAILDFGDRLRDGGVGLFFYAGHGMQVAGRNFLVPIGAEIRSERDVELEAIDVARVLARMDEAKNRLNIVVLDACRDNPFGRSFRSASRGLAQIDAPTGTLIAYATAPGKLARDGDSSNGLYTGELLRAMREPDLKLEDVFKRVRQAVRQKTKGEQVPWEASSVEGDFIFALKPGSQIAAIWARPEPPKMEGREEIRQELGSLALSSAVAGVEVWLGEQKVWTSRPGAAYILANVPAGTHRIAARKAGSKDWERDVDVAANQRAEVVIDIEPLGPAKTLRTEDGAEMVLVPAGEFWMGSSQAEVDEFRAGCRRSGVEESFCKTWGASEMPQHRVTLDAFYLDRYEVSNALFERFVWSARHRTTAERDGHGWVWRQKDGKLQPVKVDGADWERPSGSGSWRERNHPVVQVSWNDADAYCKWAGKRLPTEAEWEKAARGTDGRLYPWGGDLATVAQSLDASKANGNMSVGTTSAVGSYSGGVSPYGIHDMAGNVAEWAADWFDKDYYQHSPERNPRGPETGSSRVLRGGSWIKPSSLRTAARDSVPPGDRSTVVGFRCATNVPK
jgi:formylglycine-generating enzyme required for sulfatase activity